MRSNGEAGAGKSTVVLKRLLDILLCTMGIIFFAPLMALVAVSIKLDSRGPVLFKQERVGINGRHFLIYKFRTMAHKSGAGGLQITAGEDKRITRLGKYIRKYKMDELPQLFNVLRGEMSIVGPRPEVPKYVGMYDDSQRSVLSVKPGITDYASIEFKTESELLGKSADPEKTYVEEIMPKKLELNMRYIEEMSVYTDVMIIFKTVVEILKI
ncbi:Sugar transferase involved in LPS biosynthesis (colanic, teichoic acid) [Peptoclostridium litorale DSM 5388]|uniref:UDP-N-acetylgalactosamine-undecaprenyl-phosphate N-acetylgalactosaminephosphotransferase WecA n=1 Tax=Peptoclostridium litorale DSM 5388 TaxID=1121324 RepID=A0A069RC92_PEPLI|nr:sugar transferase [Peptoclostridium litorale]KDR94621.1 UDP-N-acetylgalactosamine-undecaprenyl-phosphate N-acetylgalactosaminephosphotransferase WecA [Peptoclostridium litorale DSM 5388]SIO30706.1 Sugar transferase involved in LPS biosynthesis (colanic, teichoic acid) [Peptoclostridium litorale DSM 5388]